jgi:hypothetical protein
MTMERLFPKASAECRTAAAGTKCFSHRSDLLESTRAKRSAFRRISTTDSRLPDGRLVHVFVAEIAARFSQGRTDENDESTKSPDALEQMHR